MPIGSPAAVRRMPITSRDGSLRPKWGADGDPFAAASRERDCAQQAQRAVYVRQIGPMLVELLFQRLDELGELAALLDEAGDGISVSGHAALQQAGEAAHTATGAIATGAGVGVRASQHG